MFWNRSFGRAHKKYFKLTEFECHCGVCKPQMMNEQFLDMLDAVREEYGAPITVTSGFRCARWQAKLRKDGLETAHGKSSHETGQAADLHAEDMVKLKDAVDKIFSRYSIAPAITFIHVDNREGGPRRWAYLK